MPPQQGTLPTLAPRSSLNPPWVSGTPYQDVPNDRLSGEGVRPKDSACFDLYVLGGKGSRLSQMNPNCSGLVQCWYATIHYQDV